MSEFKLIFKTYGHFYLKHKGLLLLFLLGFSLGSALLSAIQGLNLEAGKRYNTTTALIENPVSHFIRPALGEQYLPHRLWRQLKQQGIEQAQPVLEGIIKTNENQQLLVRGVNLFQWFEHGLAKNKKNTNSRSSFQVHNMLNTAFADPKLINIKNLKSRITVKVGDQLKVITIEPMTNIGSHILMDISLADTLLQAHGNMSYIELTELELKQKHALEVFIKTSARLESAQEQSFDSLSDAFFFNLHALALLGYVVGAFLSFNAIKLAFNSRSKLQTQMSLLGCRKSRLLGVLGLELIILSCFAALIGAFLGVSLANLLVMDISSALKGLYQLDRSFTVQFNSQMALTGFILNTLVIGLFFVSLLPKFISKIRRHQWLITGILIIVSSIIAVTAQSKLSALLLCVCVLLLFFAVTPHVVKALFNMPWYSKKPLVKWLKADSKVQLPALLSSILAILMAMGAAVGMQIMVGSFSDTLDIHLEKRLSADLYVRPGENNIGQLQQQLSTMVQVQKVGVYWYAKSEYLNAQKSIPATIMAFGPNAKFNQHLTLIDSKVIDNSYFYVNKNTVGCLVNEPALLQYQVKIGQLINFKQQNNELTCQVTGAFYDYGEQELNVVVTTDTLKKSAFKYTQYGLSLWLHSQFDADQFSGEIMHKYKLDSQQVIANKRLKKFAKALFSKTFYVTQALNIFIMLIALFGMWVSFLTLGRNQLQPMAVLQTLGVTQTQLLKTKLLQTALIIFVTLLLALPLGYCLGWVLLNYVMPLAFGWTMAMSINILQLLVFSAGIFILALCISALPLIKLTRHEVADNVAQL